MIVTLLLLILVVEVGLLAWAFWQASQDRTAEATTALAQHAQMQASLTALVTLETEKAKQGEIRRQLFQTKPGRELLRDRLAQRLKA